jgi:erythromycin esterase-like protein
VPGRDGLQSELRQRAVLLRSVRAGSGFDDLAAFGNALADARVVALGEATHGTREIFRMKHRLFEYLVQRKGFTVFALEANRADCIALDRYVKSGQGNARAAQANLHLWPWNTQEVVDLIEWMRVYNAAPGRHLKLSFTGFASLRHDVRQADREEAMAGNVLRLLGRDYAGQKMVIWAHNFHVETAPSGGIRTMGTRLRSTLGQKLYALGLVQGGGELRAKVLARGRPPGEPTAHQLPPLPADTANATFHALGEPLFFLDLRSVPAASALGRWLAAPHRLLQVGAIFRLDKPDENFTTLRLSQAFDGVLYIDQGHATTGP